MKLSSNFTKVISLVLVLTFAFTNSIGYTNPSALNLFSKGTESKNVSLTRTLAAAESIPVVNRIRREVGLQPVSVPDANLALASARSELRLERGHVIANHIMVSGHLALIPSLFSIEGLNSPGGVFQFLYASWDALISLAFWLTSFHVNVWWHMRAQYWEAVRQLTLSLPKAEFEKVKAIEKLPILNPTRLAFELKMFVLAPYGKIDGIVFDGLSYYVKTPFNLAVEANGPRQSGRLAKIALPLGIGLIALGFVVGSPALIILGRFFLPIGAVALLDRYLANRGMLEKFNNQEAEAARKSKEAEEAAKNVDSWINRVQTVKDWLRSNRMVTVKRADGAEIQIPWGFRNSGMGGRHTEKEYPESNISMQEAMFIPISARSVEQAQEMTVALQNRLKEIIELTPGSRVMGIGLEGGLAPYVTPDEGDEVPELKLWRMMTQAIKDLGYVPGKDVVLALDSAMSELENAFREENPDAVGVYLFWRDQKKVVMTREQVVDLYAKALSQGIPIVSVEDGFSERDDEGFALFQKRFGDKMLRIGDDLVTTNDKVIEEKADLGLLNALLTKYNQIGTLAETNLAMLTALGKGLDLVISHRSKSPNDDGEAQVAMSTFALGSKFGGGANTERLVKYQAFAKVVAEVLGEAVKADGATSSQVIDDATVNRVIDQLAITDVTAYEEPTNAGIPTVGVEITVGIPGHPKYSKLLRFTGSTPLGTSAGTGEAIHLVDSTIERNSVTDRHPDLFKKQDDGTFAFKKEVKAAQITEKNDEELTALWKQVKRYGGKGVLNAVQNVLTVIKPAILGKKAVDFKSIAAIDHMLLSLEIETAKGRGKDVSDAIAIAQRKGNLGMNAILSASLALARFKATAEGKQLWELNREELQYDMARVIVANGGDSKAFETAKLKTRAAWDELVKGLQEVEKKLHAQGRPLHEAIRSVVGVYDFSAARSELRKPSLVATAAAGILSLNAAAVSPAPQLFNAAVAPIREVSIQASSVSSADQAQALNNLGFITAANTNQSAPHAYVVTNKLAFDDSAILVAGPLAQALGGTMVVIAPTRSEIRMVSEVNQTYGTRIIAVSDYRAARSELRRLGIASVSVAASANDSTSLLSQYFNQIEIWGKDKLDSLFSLYRVTKSLIQQFQARLAVLIAA